MCVQVHLKKQTFIGFSDMLVSNLVSFSLQKSLFFVFNKDLTAQPHISDETSGLWLVRFDW